MRRTAEHEPFVPLDMPLVHDDPESFPHAESSLLAHFMTNNTAHLSSCIGVSNNRNCLGCTIYFEVFRRFRALARDGTKIDLVCISLLHVPPPCFAYRDFTYGRRRSLLQPVQSFSVWEFIK